MMTTPDCKQRPRLCSRARDEQDGAAPGRQHLQLQLRHPVHRNLLIPAFPSRQVMQQLCDRREARSLFRSCLELHRVWIEAQDSVLPRFARAYMCSSASAQLCPLGPLDCQNAGGRYGCRPHNKHCRSVWMPACAGLKLSTSPPHLITRTPVLHHVAAAPLARRGDPRHRLEGARVLHLHGLQRAGSFHADGRRH